METINVKKGNQFMIPKRILKVIGWVREDGKEVMIEYDQPKNYLPKDKEVKVNCFKCGKPFITTEFKLFDLFMCKGCYLKSEQYKEIKENE